VTLSSRQPALRDRRTETPQANLVGRSSEVATLRAILERRGAAVLVGESGIGKSSLIAAATAGFEASMGGAFGMLRFLPYLPLIRAVGPLSDRDPATVASTVELVAGGLTNGQIAARLGVTTRTVATLVANAAAKLGTRSRVQTALRAAETA